MSTYWDIDAFNEFYNEWLDHQQDIANAYLCDTEQISTNNPEEE